MSDNWNTLRSQLEYFSKPFPQSAFTFADEHRDELAPYLVDVLTNVATNPAITADGNYMLHLYAMHLLSAWREPRAFVPMLALGCHSDDVLDHMMGDTLTESYPRCLASVCDGNLQGLKDLFENSEVSYWARVAALNALKIRVLEGDGSRDELIAYLISCGDIEASRLNAGDWDDFEVLDYIVHVAVKISAFEMKDRIESWFDQGLLDNNFSHKDWAIEKLATPFEIAQTPMFRDHHGYIRDAAKVMQWWSAFQETPVKKIAPPEVTLPIGTKLKIGRNDPCPCGSGSKYKKCHGAG